MKVADLIESIIPIYQVHKNDDSVYGFVKLESAWEIGDHIMKFVNKNKIAPHALYREVYGLSEGSSNISKKSYIPREFQGRCYRIRKIFKTKEEMKKLFPSLKSFTLFREAMPFFDNPKCILNDSARKELIDILNSDQEIKTSMSMIRSRLSKRLGIKNSRKQRLIDVEDDKDIFIKFYNYVYEQTNNDSKLVKNELIKNKISDSFIKTLAKNTNYLMFDNYAFTEMNKLTNDNIWQQYVNMILKYSKQKDKKLVRRFRRVIPLARISKLSQMLNSLVLK